MGLKLGFSKLLSFTQRSKSADVKVNPGPGDNVTAKHTSPPGEDSHPLETDSPALTHSARQGTYNVYGYVDEKNPLIAEKGEKRFYSRDANGDIVGTVWMRKTGEILMMNENGIFLLGADGSHSHSNSSGFMNLEAGGNLNLNGVIIDPAGNITTPTSVTSATVSTGGMTVTGGGSVQADSAIIGGKEIAGHDHGPGTFAAGGDAVTGVSGANN